MIYHTFLHYYGIGPKREAFLWKGDILDWDELEKALKGKRLKGKWCFPLLEGQISLSREKLKEKEPRFFTERIPAAQQWRLFAEFREGAAYLDIETTGLGGEGDHITTISLYDGERLRYYVWGENLQNFPEDIEEYNLIITYNGRCFDLPFIERQFGIKLNQAHIDLRYILAAMGLKGGLKSCERHFGLDRGDLEGVDGYIAVLLWREYRRRGNVRALETLLSYNMEDTVNLEKLAVLVYNTLVASTPFAEGKLPLPEEKSGTPIPFRPSREIIEKLRFARARRGW